jgi:hypothetical protein
MPVDMGAAGHTGNIIVARSLAKPATGHYLGSTHIAAGQCRAGPIDEEGVPGTPSSFFFRRI